MPRSLKSRVLSGVISLGLTSLVGLGVGLTGCANSQKLGNSPAEALTILTQRKKSLIDDAQVHEMAVYSDNRLTMEELSEINAYLKRMININEEYLNIKEEYNQSLTGIDREAEEALDMINKNKLESMRRIYQLNNEIIMSPR
jgi:hypothetical protein